MARRVIFVVPLILFAVLIHNQTQAELSTVDILRINVTDLLLGIDLTDAQKERIINCINATGADVMIRCSLIGLSLPAPITNLLNLTQQLAQSEPVQTVLSTVEEAKKIITNPLSSLVDTVKTTVEEAPAAVAGAVADATGANAAAQALVDLAKEITQPTEKPDPHDPYQDISDYLKDKYSSNTKSDIVGALRNKVALVKLFASTDPNTLRKYGSKYNPLYPDVLMVGYVKTVVHT